MTEIGKTAKTGADLLNSKHYWESMKRSSLKIKKQGIKQEKNLKKHSPRFYRKLVNGLNTGQEEVAGKRSFSTGKTPTMTVLFPEL